MPRTGTTCVRSRSATAAGPGGKNLDQAQEEAGVPPGVWMGKALPAVGLIAGSRVTHRQMANLFGKGRYPASEQIIEDRLAAVRTPAKAERAARLGYRIQKWSGPIWCSARRAASRSSGPWPSTRSGRSSRPRTPA
ncbi:relaxase domain-containing protein [Streptomyces yanii]|uniref:Relaxase domain-containing protein n=1 Tax=Streptomyces yanii TaxID=78510 RepID=A0ABV5R4L5_9ACTN